jgi:glycosyltransferase involved in cell wall biosynthesis
MRVSIVIPLFEAGPFVAEAIESVLAQTYPVFEIIVVDDGSTDDGAATVAAFGPPVQLVRQEHAGIGAARNAGIRCATGDVLGFLDADDRSALDKIERQVAVLDLAPDVDGVFGAVHEFVSDGDSVDLRARVPRRGTTRLPSTLLVRRAAFDRVGEFNETLRRSEGIDWIARADDAGLVLRGAPEAVVHRRLHLANNGMREIDSLGEYARTLKTVLDRRREK